MKFHAHCTLPPSLPLKPSSDLGPAQVPVLKPMDLMVEVSPRRIFANGHTYHINSISVNSDCETYMSADDLRINLWHLAVTDRSFSILVLRGGHVGGAGAGLVLWFMASSRTLWVSMCVRPGCGIQRPLLGEM